MNRKKKLKIIQLSLLVLGSVVILITYTSQNNFKEKIISQKKKEEINSEINQNLNESSIFYNIEYSGLDLAGNRYIVKSKKGFNDGKKINNVNMSIVEAIFYFKDDTELSIKSNEGIYNNKTLNMEFKGNIIAEYLENKLFADSAIYLNSDSSITIKENVKLISAEGNFAADLLYFDIKKKTLDVRSYENNKINAELKLK